MQLGREDLGNKSTIAWLGGVAALVTLTALLVALLDEPHPAPQGWPNAARTSQVDMRPRIAQAAVSIQDTFVQDTASNAQAVAPAPIGEVANDRQSLAPRRHHTIAVGHNARGMYDPALEQAFGAATGLDIEFGPCGDRDAVELMMMTRVDLALLGDNLSPREIRAGLRETRVGLELYALAVAPDFPLQSLSSRQVRQVLTGGVKSWQQLGCDCGAIVVVAPSDKQLAARITRKMILGDNFTEAAVRVPDERHVADQLLRNPGAIAVVRVQSTPPMGMKLLQIDWTPPSADAFQFGNYPYGTPLNLVTSGKPGNLGRQLLDFAASDDGRELLSRSLLLR